MTRLKPEFRNQNATGEFAQGAQCLFRGRIYSLERGVNLGMWPRIGWQARSRAHMLARMLDLGTGSEWVLISAGTLDWAPLLAERLCLGPRIRSQRESYSAPGPGSFQVGS